MIAASIGLKHHDNPAPPDRTGPDRRAAAQDRAVAGGGSLPALCGRNIRWRTPPPAKPPRTGRIRCTLGNRSGPVAAPAWHPDAVHVGQVGGDLDRRRHDRIKLPLEAHLPQHLLQISLAPVHALPGLLTKSPVIETYGGGAAPTRRDLSDWRVRLRHLLRAVARPHHGQPARLRNRDGVASPVAVAP